MSDDVINPSKYIIVDPELKLTLVDKKTVLVFSFKVVLAFKRKRFGLAWPGTFRLQAEALWLESFWLGSSSNGSVLLEPVSVDMYMYVLVTDPRVMQYRTSSSYGFSSWECEFIILFQDGSEKERREEWIKCFYFYLMYRIQSGGDVSLGGVHGPAGLHGGLLGGLLDGLLGGRLLGRREGPSLEEGGDALVCDGVGVEHFQEGGLIFHLDEGAGLVQLHEIQVLTINFRVVHKASFNQLGDPEFEIGICLGLQAPDRQPGPLLALLQSGREEIKIGRGRMEAGEPGKNVIACFVFVHRKWGTYLATIGDLVLTVFLDTFMRKWAGILMLRWRAVRSWRTSISFSPERRLGTARPANTRDLRFVNTIMYLVIFLFSPDNIGTLQGQKLSIRLLLVVGDSPVESVLAFTQALHLACKGLNLLS